MPKETIINSAQLVMVVIYELLRRLGLNKYESLSYEALLKSGPITAYHLSSESTVPFGRIYDCLKALSIQGFVEVVPGKPKKFKAIIPETAVNNLVLERSAELEKLKQELVSKSKSIEKEEQEVVTVSYGRTAFGKKLLEHTMQANNELVSTAENYTLRDQYPAIKRPSKNIKRILIGPIKGFEDKVNEIKKEGVIVNEGLYPGVRFIVSDREHVTISIQDKNHEVVNISVKNKSLGDALVKLLLK